MRHKIQVPLLAGFYPAIFFLSNNWHVFSFQQNLILLFGTSFIAMITLLPLSYTIDNTGQYIYGKFKFNSNNHTSNNPRPFFCSILTVSSLLLCVYLLRNTLEAIVIQKIALYAIITALISYFVWNSYKKGLERFFYFLIIFSSISFVSLLIGVFSEAKLNGDNWVAKHKAIYDQIKFRKKPNVYLIVTESYPSRASLKAVYDIDNASFYKKMEKLGLKINHNHFSNYNHTLASLPSVFGMEHHFGLINKGNFDSFGGRRMLEAKTYNPVIDIFRANGYKIQYLHEINALIPNGAHVDFCFPSPTVWHGLKIFLTTQNIIEPTISYRKKLEPLLFIKNQIATTSRQKESCFNFLYLNFPGHSPSHNPNLSEKEINDKTIQFRNTYKDRLESANQHLVDLVEFIVNTDPDSIIIMIGDHGSWGLRTNQDMNGNTISNQLFILDRFGVFSGMRAPQILSDLMGNGAIKSHVNIFKYVFAYLSEDEKILKTIEPDDSYQNTFLMAIKDGVILKNFLNVQPTTKK